MYSNINQLTFILHLTKIIFTKLIHKNTAAEHRKQHNLISPDPSPPLKFKSTHTLSQLTLSSIQNQTNKKSKRSHNYAN